jgi:hypothetical protein
MNSYSSSTKITCLNMVCHLERVPQGYIKGGGGILGMDLAQNQPSLDPN